MSAIQERVSKQDHILKRLLPKMKSQLIPVFVALGAIIAALALVLPFYNSRRETNLQTGEVYKLIATHDMAQHLAVMQQFDKGLRAGYLYPRWLPDVNSGYGLAWTNYYPPGLYYLTSLINAWFKDWVNTLLVVSIFAFAASGFTFYLLSRQFYGKLPSIAAAVFYMTSPYHVLDLYWRGAMPELMGFILAPLVVYFAYKLGGQWDARYVAGLGLVHGVYLITHMPVAFLMTYTIAFYAVGRAIYERDWKIIVRIGTGTALAILLASVYLLPAMLETGHVAEHFSETFSYHKSYLTLLDKEDEFDTVVNRSFAIQALMLIVSIVVLTARLKLQDKPFEAIGSEPLLPESAARDQIHVRLWIWLAVLTTFMATSLSIYISKLIPKINIVSFSWRWLVISTMFIAIVMAAAIDRLSNSERNVVWKAWAYRATIAAAIVFNIWFTASGVIIKSMSHPTLKPPPNYLESGFIPKGAAEPKDLPQTPQVMVRSGYAILQTVDWGPMERNLEVMVGDPALLRFKTYNFPGWTARIDGKPVEIMTDNYGAQMLFVELGTHKINLSFTNTPPRNYGAVVSSVALVILCGLIVFGYMQKRRRKTETEPAEPVSSTGNRK
jgi:hypothetical protein